MTHRPGHHPLESGASRWWRFDLINKNWIPGLIHTVFLSTVLAAGGNAAVALSPSPFVFGLRGKPIPSLSPLDAISANAIIVESNIFEGLMEFDPKTDHQVPRRNLALEQLVIDPLTYVFRLRKDVYFHPFPGHDRDPLTAEDVKFSLERAKRSKSPLADGLRNILSIDAIGKDLIKIKLSEPDQNLLAVLATSIGHITSKTYFLSLGRDDAVRTKLFNRFPIGTGPYRLTKPLTDAKTIVLDRFANYRDTDWVTSPYSIPSVTFRFYEDPRTIVRGIDDESVMMSNLPLTEYADGIKVKSRKFALTKLTPPFLVILAINTTKPPLNDERARRLLNAGVRSYEVMGVCHTELSALPPGFQIYMQIPQRYMDTNDDSELRRLLQDPSMRPTLERLRRSGLTILAPDRADHIADQILEVVTADLQANLGITTHVRKTTVTRDIVDLEKPDLMYVEWTPDTPWEHNDASILRLLFESKSEYNLGRFRDAEIDRLFDQIRGIDDPGTTQQIYGQIQERLLQKAPFLWLPSVRHRTLVLNNRYSLSYIDRSNRGSCSTLVYFTSIVKNIRMVH